MIRSFVAGPDKDLLSDRILHNAGAVFNNLAPAKIVNK
jgi:hypothetical protein